MDHQHGWKVLKVIYGISICLVIVTTSFWMLININRRPIRIFFVSICLIIFVLSCRDENFRSEKGFVLFIDPNHWYYVPAIELKDENYLNQFKSNNLKYGIQFRPFFQGRNNILENLDTIPVDNFQKDMAPYLSTLKIVPVKIKYEVASEKINTSSIFNFSCNIHGNKVAFKFSTLKIEIEEICPLRDIKDYD